MEKLIAAKKNRAFGCETKNKGISYKLNYPQLKNLGFQNAKRTMFKPLLEKEFLPLLGHKI